MTQCKQTEATQLQLELGHFNGDLARYRHGINRRVIYTPSIKHLAERAGAYWLIDAIASHIGSKAYLDAVKEDARIAEMHFWKLVVADDKTAILDARVDSGVSPFITQAIPFTDFPLAEINIWAAYDGKHWTLYLPSEH